jgi:hypothetical protein
MTETPTGVRADEVITASVQIAREEPTDAASHAAAWRRVADLHGRVVDAVRARPGVVAAGSSNFLPLQAGWRGPFVVEGEPPPARPEDAPQAQQHSASEGYFETMGARLTQGRLFVAADDAERPAVLVVNESFVRRHLPAGPAVGRRLRVFAGGFGPLGANLKFDRAAGHREHGVSSEIVGVIEDVRNAPLGEPVEPAIYYSARQFPFAEMQVAVEAVDRYSAVSALRSALNEVAPTVPLGEVRSWGERLAAATAEPRLLMSTLLFFGLLAGLLAAIGVYGIFSWSVALRTRELAIRLALGARPTAIGRLVATQTAVLVMLGLGVGLGIVRLADAAVARVLYEISPHDLSSFAAAATVLLVAALVACVAPARRAMRLDPVIGLRQE